MYYIQQIILLLGFTFLIFQISFNADKKEMEVTYESKEINEMPVISICTFFDDLERNCDFNGTNYSDIFEHEFNDHGEKRSKFINKTIKELFEFERRCGFLNEHYLTYIYNNTFYEPFKLTSYLNFGLFCKLYQFDIIKNYNDGFFKINSNYKSSLIVFMHEKDTFPSDINLKVYSSEFQNNEDTILILLELNKVVRSRGSLLFNEVDVYYNNTKECLMYCFFDHGIIRSNFLFLNDRINYFIKDNRNFKNYFKILNECKSRCHFNELFESYFKQEKISYNCDLISNFNRSFLFENWIIFFQQTRIVKFNFNSVITLKVYLSYLCNAVSLVFGLSFFSLITSIVVCISKYIKFKLKNQNFKFLMIIISILMSYFQSEEIVSEYFSYLTTTDLIMNLIQVTPNLSVSICYSDLLINFAPNYDLKRNEFTSNYNLSNYSNSNNLIFNSESKHLTNLSVKEIVDLIDRIDLKKLFGLNIQISNRFKYINTMKENTKIFLRNGRYCFLINLQLDQYITKSTNKIKSLIETECYLYIYIRSNSFQFFFLTDFKIFPSFENSVYLHENTFRIQEETHSDNSENLFSRNKVCLNYTKSYSCSSQAICIERCLIIRYYTKYKKLPIDITFVPDDPYWFKTLNLTNDQLFFDTDFDTTIKMKSIKEGCMKKYYLGDCNKIAFNSVNSRKKRNDSYKISLYFDRVLINHKNKMEFISLVNYLIGILSMWLGFSFRIVEQYSRKILSKLFSSRQTEVLINCFLFVGLILHGYYIINLLVQNDRIAITYFQPSKFVIHPIFALCFELDKIYTKDFNRDVNLLTGNYLKSHTKNLSQLVSSIKFIDGLFNPIELNSTDYDFEKNLNHFHYKNLEIEFYFYNKYKCYEFKHKFFNTKLNFNIDLDTVFLEFNLIDQDLELMFYANKCFSLENKIYIPKYSYTTLKYIPILTLPADENQTFCLKNQDDQADNLIRRTRKVLATEYYKISTKLLPLTHSYFKYPIRDEIFYNALHQIEDSVLNFTFKPKKNCSIKYRNVALTQELPKNKLNNNDFDFKIQINPLFIDVIIEQQAKYSSSEQILQFGSCLLFWLDFSVKDFLNLISSFLIKIGFKRKKINRTKILAKNQVNGISVVSKSFIVFNVGTKQNKIVVI